jgi:RecA/RadA recombinase
MTYSTLRTPIDTLNVLGAGGIKSSSIVQIYGEPGCGKSTFCYQTASMLLKDNPDAVLHIIDVENSIDDIRLEKVFKLDKDRVQIHHYSTLEDSFKLFLDICSDMSKQSVGKYKDGKKDVKILAKEKIEKMDEKDFAEYCGQFSVGTVHEKKPITLENFQTREKMMKALALANRYTVKADNGMNPVLVIWDTIAASQPAAVLAKIEEGNMDKNAAGMNVATQVISTKISACLGSMGGKPISLFLPNQVRLKGFGTYLGPQESFYGGYALEHSCHYILRFKKIKNAESKLKNYDEDIKMKTGTDFRMKIEKTKFCPATQDVVLYINDQLGGIIVPGEELAHTALELGLIYKEGRSFLIKGHESLGKLKWTKEEADDGVSYIANNINIRKALLDVVTRHYRKAYCTLNYLYEESGLGHIGAPSAEELLDKTTLEDQCILDDLEENPYA